MGRKPIGDRGGGYPPGGAIPGFAPPAGGKRGAAKLPAMVCLAGQRGWGGAVGRKPPFGGALLFRKVLSHDRRKTRY